jgi:hypothetical protein
MSVTLWISVILLALAAAYSLRFTGATLFLGRALSDTTSGTGYQAAISPPWETAFGLVVYSLTLGVVAFSWYAFGIGRAMESLVTVFLATMLLRRFMPAEDSPHYKKLIIQSMANRYANFVRDGDTVRAAAMRGLLEKAGVPPEVLSS